MDAATPPISLVYLRISEDRAGDGRSIDNQRAEVYELLDQLHMTPDAEFVDDDVSASKFSTRTRPGYDRMVAEIKSAGRSVVVFVWHLDRLYRRPKELEALIDLVERYPVRIEARHGGQFDLNAADGRMMARIGVTIAAHESEHKADRIRLAARRDAEAGKWHGPRRFGYRLVGDGSAVLDPVEAPIVRQMADRLLAGESLRSIAAWATSTGVRPISAGKGRTLGVWHATSVRQVLAAARNAGLRCYDPQAGPNEIARAVVGPGRWPAIVTPEELDRIRTILQNPDRRTPWGDVHLLSGIARCGRCGAGLVAMQGTRTGVGTPRVRYVCKKIVGVPERGGIAISLPTLDEMITEAVIRRLSVTPAPPASDDAHARAWAAVRAARERVEALAAMLGAGELTRGEWRAASGTAKAALARAEAALRRSARAGALEAIPLGDERAVRGRWAELTVGQRRAVIVALVDKLVVHPSALPRGSRRFDSERVQLVWRV